MDVVMAADVVYEPEYFQPLVDALSFVAPTPEISVYLAYRPRNPNGPKFFDMLGEVFHYETLERPNPEQCANVTIYKCTRRV